MNSIEKTKRKVILASVLLIVAFFVLGHSFLNYQFNKVIDERVKSISTSTKKLFNLNLNRTELILQKKLNQLLLLDGLKKAVADKNFKTVDKTIKEYFMFEKEINNNIRSLTFFSSNGKVLYTTDKNILSIENFKPSLKTLSGFEHSDLGINYSMTQPVIYKNRYVGIVKLSISAISLIEDIKTMFKVDISEVKNGNTYFSSIDLRDHSSKKVGQLIVNFDILDLQKSYENLIHTLLYAGLFISVLILLFTKKSFDTVLGHFKKQAFSDSLTGLGNRIKLDTDLSKNEMNVLILGNIKEFSLINELYGISIGNYVLKRVAEEFKNFGHEYSLRTYRISSDEFVLLKYDDSFFEDDYIEILEELHKRINSLEINIEECFDVLQVEMYFGISNGSADDNLVEKSQMALKKAREKSLPFIAYSDNIDTKQSSSKIIKMKKTLKHALDNNNVVPFFQEIRDKDEKVIKYEALVRIIDFEDGNEKIIYPGDFLSVALNGGLYTYVAKEVLNQSLSFFSNREEKISINFLPNDFFQPKVIDTFLEIVEKFENPKRIVIEITEQENIEDFRRLLKVVKKLRKLGVGIAIDDFGTGYANYSHILQLKPDYLKIDGSLVRNILDDEESRTLVKSIIHFAQDLGIKTTAEFVENKEIFEMLKKYGVDEYQGYYFGKAENLLNR